MVLDFASMHTLFDDLMDKAGHPWFNAREKDQLLNMAQAEIVDKAHERFEVDEKAREILDPIVKRYSISANNLIALNANIEDFRYIAALYGTFTITDCNGDSTNQETYVPPRQLDDYYKNARNAFTKPTNAYPCYIQYRNEADVYVLEVKSDTTPVELKLFYVKEPAAIDGENNPSDFPDLPGIVHEEIVNLAVRKALGITESPRIQTQIFETQQQKVK